MPTKFGWFWGALNVVRAITGIALITVMVACWTLAIKIDKHYTFYAFDAASLVFMSGIALFLTLSELPFEFIKKFFNCHWPAFSDKAGLGWLGLALAMIGCNILGKLNSSSYQPEKLGRPWWSIVIAAGIMSLIAGIFNVICTWAMHDYTNDRNVREVRMHGANVEGHLPSNCDDISEIKQKKRSLNPFGKSSKEKSRPKISGPVPAHNFEHNAPTADNDDLNMPRDPEPAHVHEESPSQSEPQRSPIDPSRLAPRHSQHPYFKSGPGVRAPSSRYSAADSRIFQF